MLTTFYRSHKSSFLPLTSSKLLLKKINFLNLIPCFLHSLMLTCTDVGSPDKTDQ